MSLQGKGAIVTGAARGIGRYSAESLLDRGGRVVLVDINQNLGKTVEKELQYKYGSDNVIFIPTDVTNQKQLEETFQAAVEFLGYVDIIFNNAGIVDEKNWERMQAINVTAVIRGSNLAFEHMRKDKGGRGGVIVNTASACGLTSMACLPVYVAGKHAVLGFTRCWSTNPIQEKTGVRWIAICPWFVDTELLAVRDDQVIFKHVFDHLSTTDGRMSPSLVADAFIRVVEDKNSNGAIVEVTGKRGGVYRRRVLTDLDGSNPFQLDP